MLAGGCAAPGAAQEPAALQESVSARADESGWDQLHAGVSDRVRRAANWVDSFLSDERALAEENRSWVSVRGLWSIEEHERREFDGRLRARFVLPQTEERVQLVLSGDPDELEGRTPAADPLQAATGGTQPATSFGLQYLLSRTGLDDLRFEIGMRFDDFVPKPYVGARVRHDLPLGDWNLRAAERVRLHSDEGLESYTTVDLERAIGEQRLFRAASRLRWREEESGVEYGERLSLFQRVGERRLVTFELDAALRTEPTHVLDAVVARVRLSQRHDRGRILLEFAPQVAWRDANGHEPSAGLVLGLEIAFGREGEWW